MQLVRDLDIERRQKKLIFFRQALKSSTTSLDRTGTAVKGTSKNTRATQGWSWYNFVTSSTLDTSNPGVNLAKA